MSTVKKPNGNIDSAKEKIRKNLIERENLLSCDGKQIYEFLSLYFLCETACRDIICESRKVSKKQCEKWHIKIHVATITAECKKLKIHSNYIDSIIKSVFGGSDEYKKEILKVPRY